MLNLNDREWRPFFLTELFPQIQRGKRLKTENHIPGKTPYVSSSALNNGVDNFISNTEKVRIFSDCISLANSGSVGSSFYESVFGNFSFYSYKKACGQKKTVRGSKNSRRLSNGTPAI